MLLFGLIRHPMGKIASLYSENTPDIHTLFLVLNEFNLISERNIDESQESTCPRYVQIDFFWMPGRGWAQSENTITRIDFLTLFWPTSVCCWIWFLHPTHNMHQETHLWASRFNSNVCELHQQVRKLSAVPKKMFRGFGKDQEDLRRREGWGRRNLSIFSSRLSALEETVNGLLGDGKISHWQRYTEHLSMRAFLHWSIWMAKHL